MKLTYKKFHWQRLGFKTTTVWGSGGAAWDDISAHFNLTLNETSRPYVAKDKCQITNVQQRIASPSGTYICNQGDFMTDQNQQQHMSTRRLSVSKNGFPLLIYFLDSILTWWFTMRVCAPKSAVERKAIHRGLGGSRSRPSSMTEATHL